jgi:tRNA A-37 threonylcarbamoyl transferase component Bud32
VHSAVICVAVAALVSPADVIRLGDPGKPHYLHESLGLLRDPDGNLSVEQVAAKNPAAFDRWMGDQRPNFGYTHDAIWARFVVENVTDAPATWVVDVGREWLEQVDLYRSMAGGFDRQRSGAVVPLTERPVPQERPAFEIKLAPHERATFFLRIRSNGPVALLGELTSRPVFEQRAVRSLLAFGGFYAVLLVMAAFHLLLAFMLRDRGFAWLSCFLLFYCGAEMSAHGHVARFVPLLSDTAEIRLTAFLFAGAALTLVECARDVLATREWSPTRDSILQRMGLVAAVACYTAALAPRVHVLTFAGLALLGIVLLWTAIARWHGGYRPARWFTLAIASFLAPGLLAVAAILGFLPATEFTENANHVGLVAMTCLLSLGLAAQMKENQRAADATEPALAFQALPLVPTPMPGRSASARTPDESTVGLGATADSERASSGEGDVPFLQRAESLVGRFTIVRFIAQGGMGAVYEAYDIMLRSRVALKLIRGRIATDGSAMERFRREVLLARRVSHPNVCRVYELYEAVTAGGQAVHFLTMELLEGETLSEHISRKGKLTTTEALPLVRQICEGLAAAHAEGIIHRDFKSSNVLLVSRKGAAEAPFLSMRAVITDFGIARDALHLSAGQTSEARLTTEAAILGTPEYMSPEQVIGGALTEATDIYALGVVLYEMLTGTLPFTGDTPLATAAKRLNESPPNPAIASPGLDAKWSEAVLRCLARDPRERFLSALDISTALQTPQT